MLLVNREHTLAQNHVDGQAPADSVPRAGLHAFAFTRSRSEAACSPAFVQRHRAALMRSDLEADHKGHSNGWYAIDVLVSDFR